MKTVVKRKEIESIALVAEIGTHELRLDNFGCDNCDVRMTGRDGMQCVFRVETSQLIKFFETALKELSNES